MKPLPAQAWDPTLQHIIEAMHGRPIEIHCLLANHPALLNAWWNYRMHSVSGGELSQRDCELVILRVAVHMRAWYEWAAHVERGLSAGLTIDEIERVATAPDATEWSAAEAALLSTVDQLITKRHIDAATQQTMLAFYSEKQLLDVISLQGMYVTIACIIGTWPIEIEPHIAERLPDGVTEAQFAALISTSDGD